VNEILTMDHKTLTVSEEAYNALSLVKGKDESFTKVILRLAKRRSRGDLLDYVRSMPPNEELASAIERVLEKRKLIRPS
jgi:predicted CopG family antitoxin